MISELRIVFSVCIIVWHFVAFVSFAGAVRNCFCRLDTFGNNNASLLISRLIE